MWSKPLISIRNRKIRKQFTYLNQQNSTKNQSKNKCYDTHQKRWLRFILNRASVTNGKVLSGLIYMLLKYKNNISRYNGWKIITV